MPGGTIASWSVVATWPKPNYEHPVKKGDALTVLCIVLAPLTTVLVALRLWCRVIIIKQPGLDDFLIILGLVRHVQMQSFRWGNERLIQE
jgi:hypothetical protein